MAKKPEHYYVPMNSYCVYRSVNKYTGVKVVSALGDRKLAQHVCTLLNIYDDAAKAKKKARR